MSNRLIPVETAKPGHITGIYQTMVKAHKAANTPYPPPDEVYCMQACLDLIAQGFVGVAVSRDWEGGENIVGCIMLDYARWPWTHPQNPKGFHLYNQHFWVEPEHRDGGTAKRLIDFAKDVAVGKELPLKLEFSNMDTKAAVRDRFARISGLRYTGGSFLYGAPKV